MVLRTVDVTRYVMPLREGGSLPALADADDGFKYVLKFKGTGHGNKALVSDLIGGVVAHTLGFKVPEYVFINLDEAFGRTEGDEEIQDLLQASRGLNLGLHFLSGALTFDTAMTTINPRLASEVVWLDAFLTNVDRTARNTNMLYWNNELWLIDHGASLYFQYSWGNWEKYALSPFPLIKDHVLLPFASELDQVDKDFKQILTHDKIKEIVDLLPDEWLDWGGEEESIEDIKNVYYHFLTERLRHSDLFIKAAQDARKTLI